MMGKRARRGSGKDNFFVPTEDDLVTKRQKVFETIDVEDIPPKNEVSHTSQYWQSLHHLQNFGAQCDKCGKGGHRSLECPPEPEKPPPDIKIETKCPKVRLELLSYFVGSFDIKI